MKSKTTLCRAVLVVGALSLAACSGNADDPEEGQRADDAAQVGDGSAGSAGADASADGADAGEASVEDRGAEAIVEQTVALPASPDDQAVVGIQSLTVEGETMVLRLVVTPDFGSVSDDELVTLGDALDTGPQKFGVKLRLLDRSNLKEYSVISTDARWWASGGDEIGSVNGEPMHAFAVFAAPEDDIDAVDVRIHEQWPEFVDVPITRS